MRGDSLRWACKYAEELDTGLTLNYPNPSCSPRQAPDIEILGKKVKGYLWRTVTEKLQEEIESEQWHGRFLCARWQDEDLSMDECFAWLRKWPSAPTHTITGVLELYEQLTPTRVYTKIKTGNSQGEITCRRCRNSCACSCGMSCFSTVQVLGATQRCT